MLEEYFANYFIHTFDFARNTIEMHHTGSEGWRVTVLDTGEQTMTGGRLKRVARYLGHGDFCLIYGDGVPLHSNMSPEFGSA